MIYLIFGSDIFWGKKAMHFGLLLDTESSNLVFIFIWGGENTTK